MIFYPQRTYFLRESSLAFSYPAKVQSEKRQYAFSGHDIASSTISPRISSLTKLGMAVGDSETGAAASFVQSVRCTRAADSRGSLLKQRKYTGYHLTVVNAFDPIIAHFPFIFLFIWFVGLSICLVPTPMPFNQSPPPLTNNYMKYNENVNLKKIMDTYQKL